MPSTAPSMAAAAHQRSKGLVQGIRNCGLSPTRCPKRRNHTLTSGGPRRRGNQLHRAILRPTPPATVSLLMQNRQNLNPQRWTESNSVTHLHCLQELRLKRRRRNQIRSVRSGGNSERDVLVQIAAVSVPVPELVLHFQIFSRQFSPLVGHKRRKRI